jgi:hypothetical protein
LRLEEYEYEKMKMLEKDEGIEYFSPAQEFIQKIKILE